MGKKVTNKGEIKERILEIFDVENRPLNIREVTLLLLKRYKLHISQPVVKKYLDELEKNGDLDLE